VFLLTCIPGGNRLVKLIFPYCDSCLQRLKNTTDLGMSDEKINNPMARKNAGMKKNTLDRR
jgi:hypothetical protein